MRKFLTLSLVLWLALTGISQTCDIQTPGIEAQPTTISVGQTSDLKFSVFNNANGGSCQYAANSVLVIISLPSNGLAFQSIISPVGGSGPYFTWSYLPGSNVVTGINQVPIGDGQGEVDITVRVIGTILSSYPTGRQVNINIIQNPSGPIFPANNPGNDNGFTTITITAPLPINLVSFKGENKNCNTVELSWETASERNNHYFEIQRSEDGQRFETIAKVYGSNLPTGDSYTYADVQDLRVGQTYYYRLKQVDFDGRIEVFDVIGVTNKCTESDIALSLYPNPAFDKVFVVLKGMEYQDNAKIIITNAIGEQVITVDAASVSTPNEIKLHSLPAGIYNVKIDGQDEISNKRFIKVN